MVTLMKQVLKSKLAVKLEAVRTTAIAAACWYKFYLMCRCHTYAHYIICSPARIITLWYN
jgi:hypothetical protein